MALHKVIFVHRVRPGEDRPIGRAMNIRLKSDQTIWGIAYSKANMVLADPIHGCGQCEFTEGLHYIFRDKGDDSGRLSGIVGCKRVDE